MLDRAALMASVESTVQVVAGATGLTAAALIRADPETQSRVNGWVDRLRTGWTPNRGQIADASGHPAGNVLFTTTVGDAQIYVTTTGISHYFLKREPDPDAERIGHHAKREPEAEHSSVEWNRVDVALSTHSEGGVTAKDIDLAKQMDGFASLPA